MKSDGPSDLARRTFAKALEGDGESSDGDESSMPDAGAVAAKRFKKALNGGSDAEIYSAFKALKEECEGGGEEDSFEMEE